jgi:hypothetical protein
MGINEVRSGAAFNVTYSSTEDLIQTLIRAAMAHGQHEQRIGHPDPEWPVWYAEYMVNERTGTELPQ